MRDAFVDHRPRTGRGARGSPPRPAAGQVVVDVERVGVCGTDVEFFTGEMAYLHQGHAAYPMRLGHEWCGTVSAVGAGVDDIWLGRRVTGDTMLGCGHCQRCRAGRHNVCANRLEIGIRGGWPGALAEQLAVPAVALLACPTRWTDAGGRWSSRAATRCAPSAAPNLRPGRPAARPGRRHDRSARRRAGRAAGARGASDGPARPVARFARARLRRASGPARRSRAALGRRGRRLQRGRPAGAGTRPRRARQARRLHRARRKSEPDRHPDDGAQGRHRGRHPQRVQGLAGAIERYASGAVDPRPLVAATVGLDRAGQVLAGWRPEDAGPGPKIHVDPRAPNVLVSLDHGLRCFAVEAGMAGLPAGPASAGGGELGDQLAVLVGRLGGGLQRLGRERAQRLHRRVDVGEGQLDLADMQGSRP